MVKSSNCCLVQTFSLPNILSSFFLNEIRKFSGRLKHSEDSDWWSTLFAVFFSMSWPLHLFLEFGKARLILSRLLANMQLRLDTLSSSHNYFCGNTKILRAD